MTNSIDVYINQKDKTGNFVERIVVRAELIQQRKYSCLVKLDDGKTINRKNRDLFK